MFKCKICGDYPIHDNTKNNPHDGYIHTFFYCKNCGPMMWTDTGPKPITTEVIKRYRKKVKERKESGSI